MGAPEGNQNAAKGREWAKAVERAIDAYPNDVSLTVASSKSGLHKAAYAFVHEMMETKNIAFFKEFGDRIDGKAAQAIVGDRSFDPLDLDLKHTVEFVMPNGQSQG